MRFALTTSYILSIIYFTFVLSACNSSKSSSNEPVYIQDSIVLIDDTQQVNQSVDLVLLYPNDEISNITWQQTTGPTVDILANKSKVISFTPTLAGEYGFTVNFTVNNTAQQTLSREIIVTGNNNEVTARLSHSVLPNNNVSLRASLSNIINSETLKWQQISGPSVSLAIETEGQSSDEQRAIFFDAPQVNTDTIISFSVSANDFAGISHSDTVAVLVEATESIASNAYFSDRVADVFVYNATSPYASDLINCVYSNQLSSSCQLAQVPLIAQEVSTGSSVPTVDDIMDRVVVSHQWMGDRFKTFLQQYDDTNDIKNLLRATTAIVISYDIRPSFYWAATGAIYLDADNFWLTPNERDTINQAADYRSSFGNELQFVMPWRYVQGNNYASQSYSEDSRVFRTAEDALYRLQALLYHELAHANDFFPSNEWYTHSANTRVLDAALKTNFESDSLAVSYPLISDEMYGLAAVSFQGETANSTQKSYQPSDIESFFSNDSASDYYAYASLREDFAMLFEAFMMQSRFGLSRDVAITNQPTGDNISAFDYIVTWGQRGRIGDDKLKDRVLFTAKRVLPEFDSETAINNLPSPISMTAGENWIDNLTISPEQQTISSFLKTLQAISIDEDIESFNSQISIQTPSLEGLPIENKPGYYHKPLPNF